MDFCMPYDLFVNVCFLTGGALTSPICSPPVISALKTPKMKHKSIKINPKSINFSLFWHTSCVG